jgi:hypothetical protein
MAPLDVVMPGAVGRGWPFKPISFPLLRDRLETDSNDSRIPVSEVKDGPMDSNLKSLLETPLNCCRKGKRLWGRDVGILIGWLLSGVPVLGYSCEGGQILWPVWKKKQSVSDTDILRV